MTTHAAYQRLALTILRLDVATLAAEFQARRPAASANPAAKEVAAQNRLAAA